MILDASQYDFFIEHGFLVLPGIVPLDTVEAAVRVLECEPGSHGRGMPEVEACTTDHMLDGIGKLFGQGYTLRRRRGGSDMPRPHQPDVPWPIPTAHVDDSYPTMTPNGWAIGSFIFLTKVQYLANPGDVLLFHHLTGHTGSSNVVDPATRHALLNRWHPEERIVPGNKPTEQQTTVEKSNSAVYLSDRFNLDLPLLQVPEQPMAEKVLADGISLPDNMVSYAILHFDGKIQLLYIDVAHPATIQTAVSDDFVTWAQKQSIAFDGADTIQLHQYYGEATLGVTFTDGTFRVYETFDFLNWELMGQRAGVATATPWYVYAEYPSKVAGGQALY